MLEIRHATVHPSLLSAILPHCKKLQYLIIHNIAHQARTTVLDFFTRTPPKRQYLMGVGPPSLIGAMLSYGAEGPTGIEPFLRQCGVNLEKLVISKFRAAGTSYHNNNDWWNMVLLSNTIANTCPNLTTLALPWEVRLSNYYLRIILQSCKNLIQLHCSVTAYSGGHGQVSTRNIRLDSI